MKFLNKRRILGSSVYIALGLTIIAVIAITVVTVVGMKKGGAPETPDAPVGETTAGGDASVGIFDDPTTAAAPTGDPPAPVTGGGEESKTPADKETQAIVNADPVFCMPAEGTLLKGYSAELPIRSLTMNDYRTHAGVDISAPAGSAVKAAADGTVLDIWSDPMMGICLSVDHGGGLCSVYKNLDTLFPEGVKKGAAVKAGQTVASVGNTCLVELADTDHLHFEMTFNGKHVDPGSYLDLSKLAATDAGEE